jgi:hypothetical protein
MVATSLIGDYVIETYARGRRRGRVRRPANSEITIVVGENDERVIEIRRWVVSCALGVERIERKFATKFELQDGGFRTVVGSWIGRQFGTGKRHEARGKTLCRQLLPIQRRPSR